MGEHCARGHAYSAVTGMSKQKRYFFFNRSAHSTRNLSTMAPGEAKMTSQGGKMTPQGRLGDQFGPGSEPDRSPGGVLELPGTQKVDFGRHLGGQNGSKIYQNELPRRKNIKTVLFQKT